MDNLSRIPGAWAYRHIAGPAPGEPSTRTRQRPYRHRAEGRCRQAAGRISSAFLGWDLGRNDHTDELEEKRPAELTYISILHP